jgi:hypothetical protein
MGHRLERVPEKDQEIDLALRDLRSDLLVTTERSALEFDNLKIEFPLQQSARCSSGKQLVLSQEISIKACPLQQISLLIVMRDNGYLLRSFRRRLSVFHAVSCLPSVSPTIYRYY